MRRWIYLVKPLKKETCAEQQKLHHCSRKERLHLGQYYTLYHAGQATLDYLQIEIMDQWDDDDNDY